MFSYPWKNSGKRGSTRDPSSKEEKDYFVPESIRFFGAMRHVSMREYKFRWRQCCNNAWPNGWKLNIEGNSRTTATWGEVKVALEGEAELKKFRKSRRICEAKWSERGEGRDARIAMRTWHFWFPASTYSLCSYPPTYLCVFSVSTRVHKPCRPPPSPSTHKPSPRFFHPTTHRHRDSTPPLCACILTLV